MLSRPILSRALGRAAPAVLLLACSSAGFALSPGEAGSADQVACTLAFGQTSVQASVARTAQALTLTLDPADRACLQVKRVRLLSPSGKRLKPQGAARAPVSIGVGVGTGSGGRSASIFVSGGAAGADPGVYRFLRHLPAGAPGAGWVWLIEAVNGCRQERFALRVPAPQLASCQVQR